VGNRGLNIAEQQREGNLFLRQKIANEMLAMVGFCNFQCLLGGLSHFTGTTPALKRRNPKRPKRNKATHETRTCAPSLDHFCRELLRQMMSQIPDDPSTHTPHNRSRNQQYQVTTVTVQDLIVLQPFLVQAFQRLQLRIFTL
jgi:hypothetical protein